MELFGVNKPVNQIQPLLSVCVPTYQHKDYIRDCLDGILMQQTSFPYEIILGEDESTDGTRGICVEYANKYQDKIRLFLRSRKDVIHISGNPTGRFNLTENFKAAKGKYIALCDGDDYWTDPYKLQKQVDLLDKNPEYSICFTDCLICDEHGSPLLMHGLGEQARANIEQRDLCSGKFFRVPTVVFRNIIRTFPKEFYKVYNADIFLFCLLLNYGKAGYINEVTANYRQHEGGIWSFKDRAFMIKNNLNTYITLLSIIDNKNRPQLLANIRFRYKRLDNYYRENKQFINILKTRCRFIFHRLKYRDFKFPRVKSLIIRTMKW